VNLDLEGIRIEKEQVRRKYSLQKKPLKNEPSTQVFGLVRKMK
jgi:hypothetical protein